MKTRQTPVPAKKNFSARTATEEATTAAGGELHQSTTDIDGTLTTNQGLPIADNQNSLKAGMRGATLLEDFVLREKITHFDHERIPERVVHARGYAAHGHFQSYKDHAKLTRANFLCDPKRKTPVFVRFSTVAGSEGSADTVRDVRGFAVKFYTDQGNYDLVGNNIPVFFIQDAIKFPDLVHAVKPEPDRGFPQAQSAHDTFWDYVALTPESTHMLMWQMSDRTIPRSFRMMDGFGVNTFKMVNVDGKSVFVKFHWRSLLGAVSLIWDEAVKICGADPDFHRRDLYDAIQRGDFPQFELSVQVIDESTAAGLDFDILDPTKLVPEEVVPLTPLGVMTLNRNVDSFFAETDQVAFCPANLVPGIDFSDDPLLQGRLFSYLDTQLTRLGSPNFQEIPVNKPKCPMHNLQRGGHMRTTVEVGRVAYEPSGLDGGRPRENPRAGFVTAPQEIEGPKLRRRSETFADHYSQARQFWLSLTPVEQGHVVMAFAFELSKCAEAAVRLGVLTNLQKVDQQLATRIANQMGLDLPGTSARALPPGRNLPVLNSISQLKKPGTGLKGRKIGVLLGDGFPADPLEELRRALQAEGALASTVALKVGKVVDSDGVAHAVEHHVKGAPSVLFDAVVILCGKAGESALRKESAVGNWVMDAFAHLKVIAFSAEAKKLIEHHAVAGQVGMIEIKGDNVGPFIANAKKGRVFAREKDVHAEPA